MLDDRHIVPVEVLLAKALEVVTEAQAAGVVLRLAGSLAVILYTKRYDRPAPPADIDLVAESRQRANVHRFLNARGWKLSGGLLLVSEIRDLFLGPDGISLDVYYGAIDGSHLIWIDRRRLESCYPAISVADLLLSKLQRRHLRDVDVWDSCAILRLTGCDQEDKRFLDAASHDWGLYMSIMQNLTILESSCAAEVGSVVGLRANLIQNRKTMRWRLRALLGPRVRWWREVYNAGGR